MTLSNPNILPEIFERSPTLTSSDAGWSQITLETFDLPPGETPEFCLDRYVISMSVGQTVRASHVIEGKHSQATFFQGTAVICPIYNRHFFCWESRLKIISLSLKPELFHLNATELWQKEGVELIPKFGFQDGLIYQMGLALQTELRSPGGGSRLYAETMANALAVYLLRNYSTQSHPITALKGGLNQYKLKLVLDYINDYLDRELGIEELSKIVQLGRYHFSHEFKKAMGISPHQYVIQQRVERAKQLLLQGKMSIGQIAIACGFSHQSHLNRHFKRLTGATPTTWLKS